MTYSELLRDPRWQRKRLEIMQRDGFACKKCGDSATTLNVHHKQYLSGYKPWEYSDDDLETLCEPCHKKEHEPEAPVVDPLSVYALDARERELLELLIYHPRLSALADSVGGGDMPTPLGARLLDAVRTGVLPRELQQATADLRSRAILKEPKALLDADSRMRAAIAVLQREHFEEQAERLAVLSEARLSTEEEAAVLSQIVASKRRQLGIHGGHVA